MQHQIAQGTLSAPSWRLIRNAKLAAHIYAPLGTEMSLGDYVRVVRMFLEAFKAAEAEKDREMGRTNGDRGRSALSASASEGEAEVAAGSREVVEKVVYLSTDLKVTSYSLWGESCRDS
jgi:glycerol-3-phosphate O-acyltransferase / dihydroxyacetone phosphate acyltransferase